MGFFKEEKLYRVEIVKKCCIINIKDCFGFQGYFPSKKSSVNMEFGFVPAGTTGYVINKFGKNYFVVDENQEGLDMCLPDNYNEIMIDYNKIKDCYRILED